MPELSSDVGALKVGSLASMDIRTWFTTSCRDLPFRSQSTTLELMILGDNDAINVHWDDLAEEDYQGLCGYVAGSSCEMDSWIYPLADLLTDLSWHYYHEWNAEVNDLYSCIKSEWEETPCRGRAQTRKEWKVFFHSSNHGEKLSPKVQVMAELIREGQSRLGRAFKGDWHKSRIWDIVLPEAFHRDFFYHLLLDYQRQIGISTVGAEVHSNVDRLLEKEVLRGYLTPFGLSLSVYSLASGSLGAIPQL
ncbi:hypothetical protein C8J57DRAFT_1532597 [Mycena rebaudengoi]|nr:hypothetical protein C8J57DRAFT_1532597 [Mycena rebaudengoi]